MNRLDIRRPRRSGATRFALLALIVGLVSPSALADDEATANRLMVEAVGLIQSAHNAPSAQEKLRLLRAADERLTEIVQRLPSTDLAVKLATGQRIGEVSLTELRKSIREAQRSAPPPSKPRKPGAPVQFWRHDADVVAVGWTPHGGRNAVPGRPSLAPVAGERVATVGSDGNAAIRDVGTGATLRSWQHKGGAVAAALSPDGRQVLATTRRRSATLHDTATGELLAEWRHDGIPSAVALFPNAPRALVGVEFGVDLVDTALLGVSRVWQYGAPVTSLALSHDGRRVLMGLVDGKAVLGDVNTGTTLWTWEHPGSGGGGVTSAAFSPDGRRILVGAVNTSAVLRDVATGQVVHEWRSRRPVQSIAYSSTGRWVLVGDETYEVALHDAGTGRTVRKWRYDATPQALAFSPDDRRLLMGFENGAVIVCDLRLPQDERRYRRTELTTDGGCW